VGVSPFDTTTWVISSDGDLEEGISSESASLAGTQQLGDLVVLWDDNRISIEGNTAVAFTEDVAARYRAYGWHVQSVELGADGSVDVLALADAMAAARDERGAPSLIQLRTVIAWPAPTLRNTGKSHGSALGADEVAATKLALGMDPEVSFDVDPEVLAHAREVGQRGAQLRAQWDVGYQQWRAASPDAAALLDRLVARELPASWRDAMPTWEPGTSIATRVASEDVINALADVMPELWGGSADLGGSNGTTIKGGRSFLPAGSPAPDADPYGRVIHFGVREHAMGAILNGIALQGLTRAFGGTFLVFSDYMRAPVRLAALMSLPSLFIWTHDSIGVGEDGPTHQPVEHLWALRAIPELSVIRPADANETAQVWAAALENPGPVGLILTRQNVPTLDRSAGEPASAASRGGYVLAEADGGQPRVLLLATGSEVSVAMGARELLQASGVPTRVVSMPCLEWFDAQSEEYREQVLPAAVRARVSVEAGSDQGWWKYVGTQGACVSIGHFGASASADELFTQLGFTPDNVAAVARTVLSRVT
jgi:transketolase